MGKRLLYLLVFLLYFCASAQVRLCSWNLCDMGQSKTEAAVAFMAQTLKSYDLVALQEIVAGPGGAKAVARLADALNRTGAQWDYCVSPPTSGNRQKRERYAFLWKTARVQPKGNAWLDAHFAVQIEREPYFGTFVYDKKEFTVVNFHAITKKLRPETEIKYFKLYPGKYKGLRLVFAGDYNCPQSHSVFNPLKEQGYAPAFAKTRTTLRESRKSDGSLASEFDNVFYKPLLITAHGSGSVAFHNSFATLKEARRVSDHLPVWFRFSIK